MNVGAWVRHEDIGEVGRMVAASLGLGAAATDEGGGGCEHVFVDDCANFGGEGELEIRRGWSEGFHHGWSERLHRGDD